MKGYLIRFTNLTKQTVFPKEQLDSQKMSLGEKMERPGAPRRNLIEPKKKGGVGGGWGDEK